MLSAEEYREIRKRMKGNFSERRSDVWCTGYSVAVERVKAILQDYLTPKARHEKLRIDYRCGR